MSETPNAADSKRVEKSAKVERRSRQQELRDLRGILQNQSGRRFYWRLLEVCGTFELSYLRGDTHETAFREGGRNIGNRLLSDLMEADKTLYSIMAEENTEEPEDDGNTVDAGSETRNESGDDA